MNTGTIVSMPGRASGLGQTYHTHSTAISQTAVANEFTNRGYRIEAAIVHHEPVPIAPVRVTPSFCVRVAVDMGIEAFGLPKTSSHFYRCPSSGGCGILGTLWPRIMSWTVNVANGLYTGAYALPSWANTMWHSGATTHGVALGMAPLSGWVQDNPWFLTALAGMLQTYGQYLTAKQVEETIKQNAPTGVLTQKDIPGILAALQAQGAVQPGQQAALTQGAQAAIGPSWLLPVAIGGGILAVIILMRK